MSDHTSKFASVASRRRGKNANTAAMLGKLALTGATLRPLENWYSHRCSFRLLGVSKISRQGTCKILFGHTAIMETEAALGY